MLKSDSLTKILNEAKALFKANELQEARLKCLKIIENFLSMHQPIICW